MFGARARTQALCLTLTQKHRERNGRLRHRKVMEDGVARRGGAAWRRGEEESVFTLSAVNKEQQTESGPNRTEQKEKKRSVCRHVQRFPAMLAFKFFSFTSTVNTAVAMVTSAQIKPTNGAETEKRSS